MVDDATADRARRLRAEQGNRSFPMIDAVVVAFGVERGWPILTGDSTWPTIAEATVQRL